MKGGRDNMNNIAKDDMQYLDIVCRIFDGAPVYHDVPSLY